MDAGYDEFLGQYIPHITNKSTDIQLVTELLEKDEVSFWGQPQITALNQAINRASSRILWFDSQLSSVWMQIILELVVKHNGFYKFIAFLLWMWEIQKKYLVGLESFILESDYKPLIQLMNV